MSEEFEAGAGSCRASASLGCFTDGQRRGLSADPAVSQANVNGSSALLFLLDEVL
jgi:hypothetical protein